jgi:flagellar export protein FliJ
MGSKKFRFEFESVLRVRESETEEARGKLDQVRKKVDAQRRRVARLIDRLHRHVSSATSNTDHDITRLRRGNTYQVHLQDTIAKEERLLHAMATSERDARDNLLRSKTRQEALKKLKAKAYERYLHLMSKEQDAEVDEFANMRTARTRAGGK